MPAPLPARTTLQFHAQINPLVWSEGAMRLEVRLRLLRCALAFYRFLDVPGLVVRDIVLTGSNAAYNYTSLSDLDVHLVVNLSATACPTIAEVAFLAKKALWSADYDVTIRGLPVELYVEDAARPATSNGVYSILRGAWLKMPTPVPPAPNDRAVLAKVESLRSEIDALLASQPTEERIAAVIERLRTMRQNGLMRGGEFSTENCCYKALRNLGVIDTLLTARRRAVVDTLSL